MQDSFTEVYLEKKIMTTADKTRQDVERIISPMCTPWPMGGYWYYSKKKVGAGLRAKYNQNMMRALLNSDQSQKILDVMMKMSSSNNKRPVDPRIKELPDHLKEEAQKVQIEKIISEDYDSLMKNFMLSQLYTYRLILLESLLTPCEGSPSVQEGYDSAEEEEVVAIENFFAQNSPDKTNSESITPVGLVENNEMKTSISTPETSEIISLPIS